MTLDLQRPITIPESVLYPQSSKRKPQLLIEAPKSPLKTLDADQYVPKLSEKLNNLAAVEGESLTKEQQKALIPLIQKASKKAALQKEAAAQSQELSPEEQGPKKQIKVFIPDAEGNLQVTHQTKEPDPEQFLDSVAKNIFEQKLQPENKKRAETLNQFISLLNKNGVTTSLKDGKLLVTTPAPNPEVTLSDQNTEVEAQAENAPPTDSTEGTDGTEKPEKASESAPDSPTPPSDPPKTNNDNKTNNKNENNEESGGILKGWKKTKIATGTALLAGGIALKMTLIGIVPGLIMAGAGAALMGWGALNYLFSGKKDDAKDANKEGEQKANSTNNS